MPNSTQQIQQTLVSMVLQNHFQRKQREADAQRSLEQSLFLSQQKQRETIDKENRKFITDIKKKQYDAAIKAAQEGNTQAAQLLALGDIGGAASVNRSMSEVQSGAESGDANQIIRGFRRAESIGALSDLDLSGVNETVAAERKEIKKERRAESRIIRRDTEKLNFLNSTLDDLLAQQRRAAESGDQESLIRIRRRISQQLDLIDKVTTGSGLDIQFDEQGRPRRITQGRATATQQQVVEDRFLDASRDVDMLGRIIETILADPSRAGTAGGVQAFASNIIEIANDFAVSSIDRDVAQGLVDPDLAQKIRDVAGTDASPIEGLKADEFWVAYLAARAGRGRDGNRISEKEVERAADTFGIVGGVRSSKRVVSRLLSLYGKRRRDLSDATKQSERITGQTPETPQQIQPDDIEKAARAFLNNKRTIAEPIPTIPSDVTDEEILNGLGR